MIEHLGEWWSFLFAPERATATSIGVCCTVIVAAVLRTAVAAADRRRARYSETQQRHALQTRQMRFRRRRHRTTRRLRLGALQVRDALCTCCWSPIRLDDAAGAARCEGCGGMQHADCARWIGGCGRYACGRPAVTSRPRARR